MAIAAPLTAADHTKILAYKFGQSRAALAEIEEEIRKAKPAQTKAIETELLKALNSPKATFECKQFVCRMLRRIGSEASVDSLAGLLTDKKLSNMARFALQGMAGEKVDKVLRDALAKTSGELKIGMIGTVAARGDRKAVAALASLTGDKDNEIARAAIAALGRIGGAEAAKALDSAKVAEGLKNVQYDAALSCAESLLKGQKSDVATAAAIYKKMFEKDKPSVVRIAALGGIARSDKANAAPTIASVLGGKDLTMQRLAAKLINEVPGAAATKIFCDKIPSLPPEVQVIVITALGTRGDKSACGAVTKATGSKDEAVRVAALDALGPLGGFSSVAILTAALTEGGKPGIAAAGSLTRLRGDGAGDAIVKALGADRKEVRASLLKMRAARREKTAVPAILKVAGSDKESDVRRAAFKALGALAAQSDVPKVVALLTANENSTERAGLSATILQISERCGDASVRTAPVIAGLKKAPDAAKVDLLAVLSRLAGDKAYAAIKAQLASGSDDVKKACVRAMAAWPDATPAAALLGVAKNDSNNSRKILAIRGFIRLVTLPGDKKLTPAQNTAKIAQLADGLKVATGAGEKKQILAALDRYPCPEGLAVAKSCISDSALAAEAKLAVSKVKWAIARGSVKATASREGAGAAKALDGNRKTFWSTNKPMRSGDWFAVDLGKSDKIVGVILDCGDPLNDYPRGYQVFVSADGKDWGKAVKTGKGTRGITNISFGAVSGRHVKIIQNGSSRRNHWAIGEITVMFE